ncbi:hypothetical protein EVAR_19421_1 [Eumeta japonica]|uniref:Uncharacterized protein n=1 Tax=Eumeta variegata TaxID=151549 RepID=A0A4C1TRK5_EUMVA|nr:hypothetical protein EVAR_19421_1 [Eumeta japonica]
MLFHRLDIVAGSLSPVRTQQPFASDVSSTAFSNVASTTSEDENCFQVYQFRWPTSNLVYSLERLSNAEITKRVGGDKAPAPRYLHSYNRE